MGFFIRAGYFNLLAVVRRSRGVFRSQLDITAKCRRVPIVDGHFIGAGFG